MGTSEARDRASGLSEPHLRSLLSLGRTRTFPGNGRVFLEGDRSDFVAVTVEGRRKIVASTADGGETVLGIRDAGSLVGELAAFDGGPRTASAVAMDAVTARIVPAPDFCDFIADNPSAAFELIRMLMGRLREGDRRRVAFGSYDATARVARLLCDLAAEHGLGGTGPATVNLVQHEIAGIVGASRESVARALAVLRDRRLVTTARGTVTIVDPDALRTFAR